MIKHLKQQFPTLIAETTLFAPSERLREKATFLNNGTDRPLEGAQILL